MSDDETNQLLRDIRDLLAGHEKRYAEYLDRNEASAKTQHQNFVEYLAKSEEHYKRHLEDVRLERKRGRVQLFVIALVIGLLAWAFTNWLIIRVM